MLLSKEQILAMDDIETRDVEVPEWGGTVRIRGLSGVERDEYEANRWRRRGNKYEPNLANARANLVALCAVDEEGKRIFTNEDVKALGRKSAAALDRLFDVAQELSQVSDEDIEELAGNFSETASDDSSSS